MIISHPLDLHAGGRGSVAVIYTVAVMGHHLFSVLTVVWSFIIIADVNYNTLLAAFQDLIGGTYCQDVLDQCYDGPREGEHQTLA